MRTKSDIKQKSGQIIEETKISGCCGPTCCSGSDDKKNINRKEK